MALEAVVFSQDPLTSYNNFCKEYNFGSWNYEFPINNNSSNFSNYDDSNSPSEMIQNVDHQLLDHPHHQRNDYSSPEDYPTGEQYHVSGDAPPATVASGGGGGGGGGGRGKRRRRSSSKNKEEVEHQRMTHIAVERNRRKQMNEYLAAIRSLMPPSYVQKGDQASIVGGAINYVKELEQLWQSLEAHHKTTKQSDPLPKNDVVAGINDDHELLASSGPPLLFGEFFSFPQYSTTTRSSNQQQQQQQLGRVNSVASCEFAAGEIEVTMVETHANVKILTKKQPKQLLRLVAGFQGLRLNVLHLNLTTVNPFVLYSFSLKVEEGCQLNSIDDIAAAANHILQQIQEEAVVLL